MKKIILLFTLASLVYVNADAQTGKPDVKVFSNFNYDLSSEEGEDAFKEFELKRSYLGYSYKFNDSFSAKVTFDVGGNSSGSAYTAFLKIAALSWKFNKNMTINFGQIGTKNFKFMEKAYNFAKDNRALGLGALGWHSLLQSKMLPFESHPKQLKAFFAKET